MNKPKKAAEMYEMDQGYIQAKKRQERRIYGSPSSAYYRGRSTIKKVRWYHKVWDEIKDFFKIKPGENDAPLCN